MPPLILVFDPGGVAVANDHHRERVCVGPQGWSQIELRRQTGVLAHAHENSVAPDDRNAFRAPEMENHISSRPVGGNREFCPVETGGVVIRPLGRVEFGPRHDDVGVMRVVAHTLPGPTTGHFNISPTGDAGVAIGPPGRSIIWPVDQQEAPDPVERLPQRSDPRGQCSLSRRLGHKS